MTSGTTPSGPTQSGPSRPPRARDQAAHEAPHEAPHQAQGYGRFAAAAPAPVEPASERLSWWALALAIVPFGPAWIPAAVLGFVALRRGRDGRDHGERRAFAALVIVGLWLLVSLAMPSVFFGLADRVLGEDEITSPQTIEVGDLRVGHCLRDALAEGSKRTVVITPCSDPHAAEVYADFDLDVDGYPGLEEAADVAEAGCIERIPESRAAESQAAEAGISYLFPQSPYNFNRDKTVTCFLTVEPDVGG